MYVCVKTSTKSRDGKSVTWIKALAVCANGIFWQFCFILIFFYGLKSVLVRNVSLCAKGQTFEHWRRTQYTRSTNTLFVHAYTHMCEGKMYVYVYCVQHIAREHASLHIIQKIPKIMIFTRHKFARAINRQCFCCSVLCHFICFVVRLFYFYAICVHFGENGIVFQCGTVWWNTKQERVKALSK